MNILAFETSCDETAIAIVEDGWKVHKSLISSSLELHKKTGGVVPEVAARAHIEAIIPTLEEAISPDERDQIDAIAVTAEPGLQTSLLVGTESAKWLAELWEKPLIPVHHIQGHVFANWLERDPAKDPIHFPVLCLSVSGGHNELILMKNFQDWEILGRTQDDAAGEAFDKVARILGLGYPGGPLIEDRASLFEKVYLQEEQEEELEFPRAWLNSNNSTKWDETSFDFSFSGLKSEVLRVVQKKRNQDGSLDPRDVSEISCAFQEAVFDVLVTKLVGAAKQHQAQEVHIAGGVSANKRLRELLSQRWDGVIRYPARMSYCTDNAAMIAAAAYWSNR